MVLNSAILVSESVTLKGMSDKQQNWPILSADKNLSCVMQKSLDFVGRQNRLILSVDKIA